MGSRCDLSGEGEVLLPQDYQTTADFQSVRNIAKSPIKKLNDKKVVKK
jgi:hypothetical protein